MATSISSNKMRFRVSEVSIVDIATNGLMIECTTAYSDTMTANVAEKATMRCGTIKTVGTPSTNISGSGIRVGDLTATQASAQKIRQWIDGNTPLFFIYDNDVSGTVAIGETDYMAGTGAFNSVSGTSTVDELAEFDFEFAVTGTLDLVA